jgi:hypothetical protein
MTRVLVTVVALTLLAGSGLALADPQASLPSVSSAWNAADALFRHQIGCGFVDVTPHDAGNYWSFDAHVGIAGNLDLNPILVDKRTGTATWPNHEAIPNRDP